MTQKQRQREALTDAFFKVPNTPQGQRFIANMREFATCGTHFKIRGRGSRKAAREASASSRKGPLSLRMLRQDLPRHLAESLAVYIKKPKVDAIVSARHHQSMDYYHQTYQKRAAELLGEIERLQRDRAELMKQRDALQATGNRLRDDLREANQKVANFREELHQRGGAPSAFVVNVYFSKGNA